MSVFNEKLRVLLHNQGWTQKELSVRLNVQPTTVQKWCAGKNQPDIKTIKALSAIFCVSYDTLLNDDQDVTIYYIIDHYLPNIPFLFHFFLHLNIHLQKIIYHHDILFLFHFASHLNILLQILIYQNYILFLFH